jgi:hypothetical protein
MDRLFDVLAVFSLLLILQVLISVRRAHIRVEYSVAWLLAGLVLLGLSRWRTVDEALAAALGLGDFALALLVATGGVFVVVLYRLSLLISRLKDANIKLVQRLAILEYRLESLDEKVKTSSAG